MVARSVAQGRSQRGVLVCGSGVGMCMSANRFPRVRAVLAPTVDHARLGRQHNDANVLCLGERLTPRDLALEILDAFLQTDFEGGRHQRRIDLIDARLRRAKLTTRPDKEEYYLNIAREVCRRGTCLRRQYGAVIVKDDQIVSTGYAGSPRGVANCSDLGVCLREELDIPAGQRYEPVPLCACRNERGDPRFAFPNPGFGHVPGRHRGGHR